MGEGAVDEGFFKLVGKVYRHHVDDNGQPIAEGVHVDMVVDAYPVRFVRWKTIEGNRLDRLHAENAIPIGTAKVLSFF
jgi:hypothetical protein